MPNLAPIGQQPVTTNHGNQVSQISGGVEFPISVSRPLYNLY